MSSQLPSLIPLDQYLADTEPSPIPDWATAVLFHEALDDPNEALAACRAFLELSDGRNWV